MLLQRIGLKEREARLFVFAFVEGRDTLVESRARLDGDRVLRLRVGRQ